MPLRHPSETAISQSTDYYFHWISSHLVRRSCFSAFSYGWSIRWGISFVPLRLWNACQFLFRSISHFGSAITSHSARVSTGLSVTFIYVARIEETTNKSQLVNINARIMDHEIESIENGSHSLSHLDYRFAMFLFESTSLCHYRNLFARIFSINTIRARKKSSC